MKNSYFIILSSLFFCGFIFFPFFVYAEKLGILVDQTSIAFDADTGETHEFVVKVTNVSERQRDVLIGAMDYVINDNNEILLGRAFDERDGVKDWITTKDSTITLNPNESKNVVFDFTAPETAPIGSHRGAVFFRMLPDEGDVVNVQGQVAVHTLINIKGNTHAGGRVSSFDIPFLPLDIIEYAAEFENLGNIHYVPYGEVVARNVFTKKEQMYKYEKHFVFPGKRYTFTVSDSIPSIFGFYQVRVSFVDGEGVVRQRTDYMTGYLFPLVFIAGAAGLVVLVRMLFRLRKKNSARRLEVQQKKHQKSRLQEMVDEENSN